MGVPHDSQEIETALREHVPLTVLIWQDELRLIRWEDGSRARPDVAVGSQPDSWLMPRASGPRTPVSSAVTAAALSEPGCDTCRSSPAVDYTENVLLTTLRPALGVLRRARRDGKTLHECGIMRNRRRYYRVDEQPAGRSMRVVTPPSESIRGRACDVEDLRPARSSRRQTAASVRQHRDTSRTPGCSEPAQASCCRMLRSESSTPAIRRSPRASRCPGGAERRVMGPTCCEQDSAAWSAWCRLLHTAP